MIIMKNQLNHLLRGNVLEQESMARHTTFKTGGPAALMVFPQCEKELMECLWALQGKEQPYQIIGRGSNLLVSDKGFHGTIIKISDGFDHIDIDGERLYAQAGASLRSVALFAIENGLSGLEFAAGIPGTLGGGVVMNAGAYGGELKEFISSVRILNERGEIETVSNEEMQFGYRTSLAQKKKLVVLGAEFLLPRGNREESKRRVAELAVCRREKQPLEYPSAGSTFKRPPGQFAGALIEECGLKGLQIGGAQVSDKHAGFIINIGNATSADLYKLIKKVQAVVKEEKNVKLEPEVRMVGEFEP